MSYQGDKGDTVVFETDRLRFAIWRMEDWISFQKLASNPNVAEYFGTRDLWSEERVRKFVALQCENWEKRRLCIWKLLPKDSDALIGICGLQPLPEGPNVEIGWWLAPSHWGMGLAAEAARETLAYGFMVNGLNRIVAVAHPANRDSLRVMEEIGMHFEREAIHKGMRLVVYAIEREQFSSRNGDGNDRA